MRWNEIVRQVRLRDLGGIIVIDFIDMDERKNRAKVVQALEEALRSDRAPTKVIAFNDFGLVGRDSQAREAIAGAHPLRAVRLLHRFRLGEVR